MKKFITCFLIMLLAVNTAIAQSSTPAEVAFYLAKEKFQKDSTSKALTMFVRIKDRGTKHIMGENVDEWIEKCVNKFKETLAKGNDYKENGDYLRAIQSYNSICLLEQTNGLERVVKTNKELKQIIEDASKYLNGINITESTALKQFFPLWGFTLGKTTWKQADALGAKVENFKGRGSRVANLNSVSFWDHKAIGRFTEISWSNWNADFPTHWKTMGFSWDNSYNTWLKTFKKLGFSIKVKKEPTIGEYSGKKVLEAEFEALSPDKTLCFTLDFDFGEHGNSKSSAKTLYSINIKYDINEVCKKEFALTSNENNIYNTVPAMKQFFPLWGFTLGKTTWKKAKSLGAEVEDYDNSKVAKLRNGVNFWDFNNNTL